MDKETEDQVRKELRQMSDGDLSIMYDMLFEISGDLRDCRNMIGEIADGCGRIADHGDTIAAGCTRIQAKLENMEQRKKTERELILSINEKVDGVRQYIDEA
jgi:hypothetical protein